MNIVISKNDKRDRAWRRAQRARVFAARAVKRPERETWRRPGCSCLDCRANKAAEKRERTRRLRAEGRAECSAGGA
jgi:hypothetical protein